MPHFKSQSRSEAGLRRRLLAPWLKCSLTLTLTLKYPRSQAYALYDPKTSYCQGMADLLVPFLHIYTPDFLVFWVFKAYMAAHRHYFQDGLQALRRQMQKIGHVLAEADPPLAAHLASVGVQVRWRSRRDAFQDTREIEAIKQHAFIMNCVRS